MGVPLEWQEDHFLNHDHTLIQCSTHGALFTIDQGKCISGPCQGAYLQTLPYHEEDGHVIIDTKTLAELKKD